jgi:phosphoserine phosphatase
MPMADVLRVAADPPATEGADQLLRVLRGLGFKTAVISGGFSFAADALKQKLGLDYAYSNQLDHKDGKLTGRVLDPVVGPQRKADLLDAIAQREGIALEQTIAIGDGANDLLMLEKAGLGIAFHAKQKLREAADTSLTRGGLDRILFLLGFRARDIREFLSDP